MTELGKRLVELRTSKKLKRTYVAKQVGVSSETLRKIEEGHTKSPRAHLVSKLETFFNKQPGYLLFGDKPEPIEVNTIEGRSYQFSIPVELPPTLKFDEVQAELQRRIQFEVTLIAERQNAQTHHGRLE